MASAFQEPVCWRAANPCPLSETSSGRKLSCQAWFRCEMAGDYVIHWRCQSVEEEEFTVNVTTLSLCHNQSDSRQLTECPPPIVCAADHYKNYSSMKNGVLSTDITIVIALAAFAFLAVLLIIVSSYKYWSLRKRYKTQKRHPSRNQSRQYWVRDYRFPISYHNFWGSSFQHYHHHGSKSSHSSRTHGNQYPDVYFSRPQESWRYFQHLLTSTDDSLGNNIGKHEGPAHVYSNGDRVKADPSVATESFVYHQPVRVGGSGELSEEDSGWLYQNKNVNIENEDREESLECYHIYKGNLSRLRPHEQHYASRNYANFRKEYHHQIKSTADFIRTPQLSSIPIPAFGKGGFQETHTRYEQMNPNVQLQENNGARHLTQRQLDSDSSYESMSHYALGLVNKRGISQHYNKISSEVHQNSRHHQRMTSHGVKVQTGVTTPTNRTSPDVINSHNFTNRFVRVGRNIYRPVLTKSPSGSSITLSSTNNNYIDLSYDSFLNEHLRELAKRGAASSSTLEAGYRQKEDSKVTELNHRF